MVKIIYFIPIFSFIIFVGSFYLIYGSLASHYKIDQNVFCEEIELTGICIYECTENISMSSYCKREIYGIRNNTLVFKDEVHLYTDALLIWILSILSLIIILLSLYSFYVYMTHGKMKEDILKKSNFV
jgi:hypothetical protein